MTEQTDRLLRDAEHYLSALHGSVARHDNLAANYGCAGCELRDRLAAELRAAVPAGQAPATDRAALLRAAALVEDRACDADFTASPDYCAGLREAAATLRRAADETPGEAGVVHIGGRANAEDCPACAGTNPDYPFICPGPDAAEQQPKETRP